MAAGRGAVPVYCDSITYSVDKDFYYNLKNEYNTSETQKEVDLVTELTMTYDPIEVISNGEEKQINSVE